MNTVQILGEKYTFTHEGVTGKNGPDKDLIEIEIDNNPPSPHIPNWGEFLADRLERIGFEIIETDKAHSVSDRIY